MIERRFKWRAVDVDQVRERSGILLQFVTIEAGVRHPVRGVMLLDDGTLEVVPHDELHHVPSGGERRD